MPDKTEEFKCARCGRLCEKATSLRRHTYYCRTRPVGAPTSRKRCCEACTRAKIRCDSKAPACSSCTSRGIQCHYNESARHNLARHSRQISNSNVFKPVSLTSPVLDGSKALTFDAASTIGDIDLSFLNLVPSPDSLSTGVSDHVPFEPDFTTSMSVSYLHFKPPKVLYHKVASDPQAEIALRMMRNVLESYPYMMLRKETFPPFISPRSLDIRSGDLPGALKDCMGSAQIFAIRTPESRSLLWRTVRMEQEKMLAQHQLYTTNELQSAVQAILIYIIMRVQRQDAEYQEMEMPLLYTLHVISVALATRIGEVVNRAKIGIVEDNWQDWLLKESRRRCLLLGRVMNMAFSIDQALEADCFRGFLESPLSAKRVLWEAQNEQQWRQEYDESRRDPSVHRLTSKGQILHIQQTKHGLQSSHVPLQEWCASQDGSGILVYLASLILA